VKVTVTMLGGDKEVPTFSVGLDTHSVNLDVYDFRKIVRLRDGQGGEIAPSRVEGVEGSGHHRRATVRFAWPEPRPKSLEVVVKDVAGVPERVFRWGTETVSQKTPHIPSQAGPAMGQGQMGGGWGMMGGGMDVAGPMGQQTCGHMGRDMHGHMHHGRHMMGMMGPGMGMMGPMMGSPEIRGTMMSIHGEVVSLMGRMMQKYGGRMGQMTPEVWQEMRREMMERMGEMLTEHGKALKERARTAGK
jgi:hypothetical protein